MFHFREVGETVVKETLPGILLPGIETYVGEDVEVSLDAPYDVAGSGGRLRVDWGPTSLDTPGDFEGELEIRFPNGRNQTAKKFCTFEVRGQIA